jgi:hypothetical protein
MKLVYAVLTLHIIMADTLAIINNVMIDIFQCQSQGEQIGNER